MSADADPTTPARVMLRPLATPLPLGFLALGFATLGFAALQLGWVPTTQGSVVALGVLAFTVPAQLLVAVLGFLARDPVAGTGVGILSGTWGAAALATLTSPPGASSAGLGVLLLASAAALLVPAVASRAKLVPALVISLSAVRFAVTGVSETTGRPVWETAAGWIGVLLALVSWYAAMALELEGVQKRTVLPTLRSGSAADVGTEPGVRAQL